jgi:hypothetical protein
MKKILFLLALLPFLQQASAQGSTHIGHFIFRVPEGWKTTQQGNLFSMTPPDLGPDEMLSFLLLDPVSDTGFLAVADATISQLATVLQGEPVRQPSGDPLYFQLYEGRCLKGWDYSFGTGNIRIGYKKGNDTYLSYITFTIGLFLAKINGRMERVCYISKDFKCGIYETSTSFKWTYDPVIDDFFFNLQFDDWKDTHSMPGKFGNTGITGVWSGVSYIQGMYRASFFILYDNGQVYYNSDWPKYGLSNLNTIAAAASDPPHWGSYSYQGGSGVMKISWQTIPFSIVDGKMTAGLNGSQRTFTKMPQLENVRLNGTWSEYNGSISIRSSTGPPPAMRRCRNKDKALTRSGIIRSSSIMPTD